MQSRDSCNATLKAIDSITITKNIVSGITDLDYPNVLITAFPNPMDQLVLVSGLSAAKSYTLSLYNGQGQPVRMVQVSGQTVASINSLALKQGIYWLEVYDNTRKRKIGRMALLKIPH
jgi:hypothetical protein